MAASPKKFSTIPYDKVWGTRLTEPWHRNPEGKQVGEVWFTVSDSLPILVKFLFTSGYLSVQVHPEGKTEMWHVLRADPGARVAIGLKTTVDAARFRAACASDEVMDLLHWIPAKAGDTFFSTPGTIHAIGPGLVLCEVQQVSDVTYRLFDYGRTGRELHLDAGLSVSRFEPYDGVRKRRTIDSARELLAECDYFRTERLVVNGQVRCESPERNTMYVALEGEGLLAGEDFKPGDAFEVAAGAGPFLIESPRAVFLTTFAPAS